MFVYGFLLCLGMVGGLADETKKIEDRMLARCSKYAESVYEEVSNPILIIGATTNKKDTCAISSIPTIVGGERAGPREFPHMAAIGYGTDVVNWRCGGSLISELWVLCAAHCTATPDNLLAKYVALGDLDLLSQVDEEEGSASPEIYKIVKRINHPGYRRPQAYNDISLYKLNQTVIFNKFIRPICLHYGPKHGDENTIIATGWGLTKHNGSASSHLRKVSLGFVDNAKCNSAYPLEHNNFRKVFKTGINGSTQLCAWAEGKDTCQGDSGGPIQQVLKEPYCMYSIVGLTSTGYECAASYPGIYTRVEHYLPWIESFVWPSNSTAA